MLKVFIGWDDREAIAYHVLSHSIITRAVFPVQIIPLKKAALEKSGYYWREPDTATTDFSLTRFLVPALSNYEGVSVYLDCDMLVQCDINLLPALMGSGTSVGVVAHDYVPKSAIKMDGKVQEAYPRKNWSSMMIFNNKRCRNLSLEYVNRATPAELHRFTWVDERLLTLFDLSYNWLVGEYPDKPSASILHYTLGGPWFKETKDCPMADLWLKELRNLNGTCIP